MVITCFSYPPNRAKSSDVLFVQCGNPVKICAQLLREKCENYNFSLDESYKCAGDLQLGASIFQARESNNWMRFFESCMSNRKRSVMLYLRFCLT